MKALFILIVLFSSTSRANLLNKTCDFFINKTASLSSYVNNKFKHLPRKSINIQKVTKSALRIYADKNLSAYIGKKSTFENSLALFFGLLPIESRQKFKEFFKGMTEKGQLLYQESDVITIKQSYRVQSTKYEIATNLISRMSLGGQRGVSIIRWGVEEFKSEEMIFDAVEKILDIYTFMNFRPGRKLKAILVYNVPKNIKYNSQLITDNLYYEFMALSAMNSTAVGKHKFSSEFSEVVKFMSTQFTLMQFQIYTEARLSKKTYNILKNKDPRVLYEYIKKTRGPLFAFRMYSNFLVWVTAGVTLGVFTYEYINENNEYNFKLFKETLLLTPRRFIEELIKYFEEG